MRLIGGFCARLAWAYANCNDGAKREATAAVAWAVLRVIAARNREGYENARSKLLRLS